MQKHIQLLDIYPYYGEIEINRKWFIKLLYKLLPIPIHTSLPLLTEIYLLWIRFRSMGVPKRYHGTKNLFVNLGAGQYGKPGWVNVDILKLPGINCIYDCRKKLPFPDNSVKGIFCEHFLEHIDYTAEAPYFLSECHRVLDPGGVIRIIVPDAEKYLRAYCEEGWDSLSRIRPLDSERTDFYYKCKYRTKMELINVVFRQGHRHKYAYDYATLEFLLWRYGFSTVQRQEFGKSLMAELCLDRPDRASESLYVEAVK